MSDKSTDPTLLLYGSPRSPYARKVRIVLYEKGLAFRYETDFHATIERVNPLGKIPVMILPDGQAIFDSSVIVDYLDAAYPERPMVPGSGMERVEIRRWEALADGICDAAVSIVSENGRNEPAERSATWIEKQKGKVERGLAHAAQRLGDRSWCCQDQMTLADAAMAAALDYVSFRLPAVPWQQAHPNLARYHACLMKRDAVASTVPVN